MRVSLLVSLCLTLRSNHGFSFFTPSTHRNPPFSRRRQERRKSTIPALRPSTGQSIVARRVTEKATNNESEGAADKLLGILVLLTVPLSWGTYVPVVRYLYAIQPPVPGFVFSACYYALASVTTTTLALWQSQKQNSPNTIERTSTEEKDKFPIRGGIELGAYLFIANCLQVIGLQTVESDRAGFLVQLTTVFVPFVEALFAQKLSAVPGRTWLACVLAFVGLFVMGLDGRVVSDPVSTFVTALSSFTRGDVLIIGAAVLYTLHVVRLGVYAKETTPMKLAASKATVETIFSALLVGGLASLSTVLGEGSGLLGFASSTGKEIVTFFTTFRGSLADGSLTLPILLPAIGAVFWTGWITCAYTIYAQTFGQSRVSPTNANLIYTFQPIFTALFAWLLLGETMGPSGFVGGAIIASSVYMVAATSFGDEVNKDSSSQAASAIAENKLVLSQNDTETRSDGS